MADEYYEISPKINDIDFFIGESKAQSVIQISSQSEVSAARIANASSSISIESSFSSAFLKEVISASAEAQIELIIETIPLEVLNVLTEVHVVSDVTSSASKITSASSSISITSDIDALCHKVTTLSSQAEILSNISAMSVKITQFTASSQVLVTTDFNTKFIAFVRQNIAFTSRLTINPPIRFSPSYIDDSSIRTFLILDGKPLTNHNRQFESSLSQLHIENINWNNQKNRYYKRTDSSGRKTFNISWSMLPNAMVDTVDSRHGRDFLSSVAEDPDIHELKIVNQDENGLTAYSETTYAVFVRSYSETLVRRYISQGVYLYDCSLTLEEA